MNKETNNNQKQIPKGFKQTDIGLIPEDWGIKSFGEIAEFKNGINFSSD